jgi:hypothetical protein
VEVVPIVTPCKNARPSDSKLYNESVFDFFGNLPPVTAAVSAIGIRLPHPMTPNIAPLCDLSNVEIIFLFTSSMISNSVILSNLFWSLATIKKFG